MTVRIEYTEDSIGAVLYHLGVVTGEELINSISSVYTDERYPRLKYWIGDRTSCSEFLPDSSALKRIAELNRKESLRNPGMLLALVAPRDIEYGLSRMFEVFSEDGLFKTKVFRSRDSAEDWIRKQLDDI